MIIGGTSNKQITATIDEVFKSGGQGRTSGFYPANTAGERVGPFRHFEFLFCPRQDGREPQSSQRVPFLMEAITRWPDFVK
jgi:hypothetical protein